MKKQKDIGRAAMLAVEQDARVKAEYQLIQEQFAGCPDWPLLAPLAARAAFLTVMIADLEIDVLKNGIDEAYTNGANQSGRKKRAAADLVISYGKLYAGLMSQLTKELGKGRIPDEPDELMQFLAGDRPTRKWGAPEQDEFERF